MTRSDKVSRRTTIREDQHYDAFPSRFEIGYGKSKYLVPYLFLASSPGAPIFSTAVEKIGAPGDAVEKIGTPGDEAI